MFNFKRSSQKVCRNCSYFFLDPIYYDEVQSMEIKDQSREDIRNGKFCTTYNQGRFSYELFYACYKKVWEEGLSNIITENSRHEKINKVSRKECPYFIKYIPGMRPRNVEEFQKRVIESKKYHFIKWTSITALIISLLALIVSIIPLFQNKP